MRKRNSVKQLNRPQNQRKAMVQNLVTSLFYHERIQTTVARAKAIRGVSEKIITRAKKNLSEETSNASKVHNIRIVEKIIKDKEVLNKIFNDIANRFKERNGGYTRVLKIANRESDNSEMAIIELVEKKDLSQLKEERKQIRENRKKKKEKQK